MPDIRNTLKPFATVRGNKRRMPGAVKVTNRRNIHIRTGNQEIYNDGLLSASVNIWGYSDSISGQVTSPGPTVESDENNRFTIEWFNRIPDSVQMPVTVAVTDGADQPYLHNVVGGRASDAEGIGNRSLGFTAMHFHGGKSAPSYDGWPESMMRPAAAGTTPQSHLGSYISDQRPSLYWYHDHAMHTTRLNAYAGLSGCWIIRGQAEKDIGLWDSDGPALFGKYDEFVLVLQDRNITGRFDNSGKFTPGGDLLHRAESGFKIGSMGMAQPAKRGLPNGELPDGPGTPLEFFGPLNLVNGALWPKFERLDAGLYRVRVLNGANARVYRLHLLKADAANNSYTDQTALMWQIGSDCGLLPEAVPLPDGCLTLAPAERADLLIDFSAHPDSEFILVNSAGAPFDGSGVDGTTLPTVLERVVRPDGTLPSPYDPDSVEDCNPFPEVLKFQIGKASANHPNSATLASIKAKMTAIAKPAFEAEAALITGNSKVGPMRSVLLEEKAMHDGTNMLVHMELAKVSEMMSHDMHPPLTANHAILVDGADMRVVAERFQDPVSFMPVHGSTETWRFINTSGDTHPMHIHLVQFLVKRRVPVTVQRDMHENITEIAFDEPNATLPDANELGFKDTVRVNPNEMVEVQMRFDGYCGRYLYHCHILEHEDHDMMRQFVVTRDDDFGHGHMWPVGVRP